MSGLEEGMTYVEKLDFREQEHRHRLAEQAANEAEQTKRAKYKLREARQETYQVAVIGFFVVTVILAVIAWIYFSTSGNPNKAPDGLSDEERREIACVESGGGYVPSDLIANSGKGLCVYPGKRAN